MAAALTQETPAVRGAAVRLSELLVRAGLLDANGVRAALARLAAQGGWLGQHVVELGLATPAQLADALAQATRTPRVDLTRTAPEPDALEKLDRAFCEANRCVPVALRDGGSTLILAMVDPTDVVGLQKAVLRSGCAVRPVVATEPELAAALGPVRREPPRRGISFRDDASGPPLVTETLAGSLVAQPPANEVEQLPELLQRLGTLELELRRTQQLVRALAGIALEKGLATREELAALAARPPSR